MDVVIDMSDVVCLSRLGDEGVWAWSRSGERSVCGRVWCFTSRRQFVRRD